MPIDEFNVKFTREELRTIYGAVRNQRPPRPERRAILAKLAEVFRDNEPGVGPFIDTPPF